MANSDLAVRPAATSWGAVLGGWVATIGASVIFAPVVAGLLVVPGTTASGDIAVAVPVVLGLFLSYIVGGYVAGRMAGYRTSWHGMMTAFFTLFVLLVLMLLGVAGDGGPLHRAARGRDRASATHPAGLRSEGRRPRREGHGALPASGPCSGPLLAPSELVLPVRRILLDDRRSGLGGVCA